MLPGPGFAIASLLRLLSDSRAGGDLRRILTTRTRQRGARCPPPEGSVASLRASVRQQPRHLAAGMPRALCHHAARNVPSLLFRKCSDTRSLGRTGRRQGYTGCAWPVSSCSAGYCSLHGDLNGP